MPLRLAIPASIVVGLALTIGLAWYCAATARPKTPNLLSSGWTGWNPPTFIAHFDRDRQFGFERSMVFTMIENPRDVARTYEFSEFDQIVRSGWPMLALECRNDETIGQQISLGTAGKSETLGLRNGFALQNAALSGNEVVWRALPLKPMWPGFVGNWSLFAFIAFACLSGPEVVRRFMRRRRGVCLACGYSLRGLPMDASRCPECGASRSH